jgi:carboxypeptidase PM20D1
VKKVILFAVAVVAVTGSVMIYRAATHFAASQPEPVMHWDGTIALDEDAAVQRFARALTFPTVSHDDRSRFDAEAFRAFHAYLQSAFPLVHEQASRTEVNRYSLVYHLEGSDPALQPVLFMSHMDVVPVEENTREEWTHPPFAGVVEDGNVWGRGALDDKIGVIALLEAMERRLATGWRPQRPIYLAFGHDEEVGGMEGAQRVAEYFANQGVRFDFVLDEGGALTQGLLQDIGQPLAVIGISEKGYVNLVLTVNAPGGHSSQPPAQTALGILARAIVKVEESPFPARLDHLLPTLEAVGFAMPFSKRLALSNLWLLSPLVERSLLADKDAAAGIRTTTAATMASGSPKSNILPTRATAVVNFRILPGETVESVQQHVVDLIGDERVGVRAEYGIDPSPVSPTDSRGYRIVAGSIRALAPDALVAPYMVRGGTDARYFYELSPNVYRFLAVRIDADTMRQVHGIDEHVAIDDYLMAVRYYYNVMGQAAEP